jgi:hypothetical protein
MTENIASTRGKSATDLSGIESNIQGKLTDERRYGMAGLEEIIKQRIAEQQRQQAMAAAAADPFCLARVLTDCPQPHGQLAGARRGLRPAVHHATR